MYVLVCVVHIWLLMYVCVLLYWHVYLMRVFLVVIPSPDVCTKLEDLIKSGITSTNVLLLTNIYMPTNKNILVYTYVCIDKFVSVSLDFLFQFL